MASSRGKATALRRSEGNPGRRPLNEDEPEPSLGVPEMPGHLGESIEAVRAWERLAGWLEEMGVLATSDQAVMAIYSDAWAHYVEAERGVQTGGQIMASKKTDKAGNITTTYYPSPFITISAMHAKRLLTCVDMLGLSPTSRTRIVANPKTKKPEGKERHFKVVGA